MGNSQSLLKDGLAAELSRFFEQHYSANLMNLAIKSNLDPNKLEMWIR